LIRHATAVGAAGSSRPHRHQVRLRYRAAAAPAPCISTAGRFAPACTARERRRGQIEITTIEGLSTDISHPVQQAWVELDTPQCGYCQPGMIMASAALLAETPQPSDADIDGAITNICRCGTLPRVREGIHRAGDRRGPRGDRVMSAEPWISAAGDSLSAVPPRCGFDGGMQLPLTAHWHRRRTESAPEVNAWVVIDADDTVTIRIARSEMGQGTLTGLAQMVAEELECDWDKRDLGVSDAGTEPGAGTSLGILLHRRQPRHPRQPPVRARGRRPGPGDADCRRGALGRRCR
jgi:aerobic-type carbon monoxide dehydrogenase small subunit (CoxS/CutS family)